MSNAPQQVPIETPGLYVIRHKWGQSPRFVGHTLAEIFEMDGGAQALLEMAEWDKTSPDEKRYLEEFIRIDPKRREVFALVAAEMKAARKRRGRQMRRSNDTWANREKQSEFGF